MSLTEEVARRAAALAQEAAHQAAALEERLRQGSAAVGRALETAGQAPPALDAGEDRARRLEEIARAAGRAAARTDLLGLNVEVAAARLGEEEQGLEQVARELRALADETARGATEADELLAAARADVAAGRVAWRTGLADLRLAQERLDGAAAAAEEAGVALAEAQQAANELASTSSSRRPPASRDQALDAAFVLAAAAEARDEAITGLGRAAAARLAGAGGRLLGEATSADGLAARLEVVARPLGRATVVAQVVDDVARRAKQLAVNADLAAAQGDDPALGLFAEEARRLSERAEGAADEAADLGERVLADLAELRSDVVRHALAVREVGEILAGVLERFADPGADTEADGLPGAWRADRVAARRLAEARAQWRRTAGPEPAGPSGVEGGPAVS